MLRLFGLTGFLVLFPFGWLGALVQGEHKIFQRRWKEEWDRLKGEGET